MRLRPILCVMSVLLAVSVASAQQKDTRDPLTRALDYAQHQYMIMDLQLNAAQIDQLIPVSRTVSQLVQEEQTSGDNAIVQNRRYVQAQRAALLAGTKLDSASIDALKQLQRDQQDRQKRTDGEIDFQIQSLRRILTRQQLVAVSLSTPQEMVGPPDPRQNQRELMSLAARVSMMGRSLEQIRYLNPANYMSQRTGLIQRMLRRYARRGSPQMTADMQFMFKLTDQMRLVKEDQWSGQLPLFAAEALQYLGALQPRQRFRRPARPGAYDWWSFYDLLSDPQTPDMLTKMGDALKAATAAAAQNQTQNQAQGQK